MNFKLPAASSRRGLLNIAVLTCFQEAPAPDNTKVNQRIAKSAPADQAGQRVGPLDHATNP
jgi:hypothetical protein